MFTSIVRITTAALFVSTLFVIVPGQSYPQTLIGGNIPISVEMGAETTPSVVADTTTGNFLVVWIRDAFEPTEADNLCWRLINADGDFVSEKFSMVAGSMIPAVVYNETDGEFFVVYGGTDGISGIRVASDGLPLSGEIPIGLPGTTPAVAHDTVSNTYFVAWQDNVSSQGGWLVGRLISASGASLTPVVEIMAGLTSDANPSIAFCKAVNRYLLVWSGSYARFINADGELDGDYFTIQGGFGVSSVAANNGMNQFLVVWGNPIYYTLVGKIYGTFVDAESGSMGENFVINEDVYFEGTLLPCFVPRVCFDEISGQYLVTWSCYSGEHFWEFYSFGRMLEHDGNFIGVEFQTSYRIDNIDYAAIASASGIFLTVWEDGRNRYETSPDIYGQLVASVETSLGIQIDIKPEDTTNTVNLRSSGVLSVAILSTGMFDAATVDPATVDIMGSSVKMKGKGGKFLWHAEDVNGDGLMDIICQIYMDDSLLIEPGESECVLTAECFDGTPVQGSDIIRILPDK